MNGRMGPRMKESKKERKTFTKNVKTHQNKSWKHKEKDYIKE